MLLIKRLVVEERKMKSLRVKMRVCQEHTLVCHKSSIPPGVLVARSVCDIVYCRPCLGIIESRCHELNTFINMLSVPTALGYTPVHANKYCNQAFSIGDTCCRFQLSGFEGKIDLFSTTSVKVITKSNLLSARLIHENICVLPSSPGFTQLFVVTCEKRESLVSQIMCLTFR